MSSEIQTFTVSPHGKLRMWIGVLMIGTPVLFLLGWVLGSFDWPSRPALIGQWFGPLLLGVLLGASLIGGLYFITVRKTVMIDRNRGRVVRCTSIFGTTIGCTEWGFGEFLEVMVRHRPYGDGPSNQYQTEVGIRHSTGRVVWLEAFPSPDEAVSRSAQDFIETLREWIGVAKLP